MHLASRSSSVPAKTGYNRPASPESGSEGDQEKMMALIDNEEAARRLARVIISDIELYEKKKIQAGDDLTAPMAEGRALFHRRVVPELASIFEAVVEAKRSGASTGGPSGLTPRPRPTASPSTAAPAPAVVEPPQDEARPVEAALSESTARVDLTAEAAAARNPELPAAKTHARDVGQDDDGITPVVVEDIVPGRSGAPEAPVIGRAASSPEAPAQELAHPSEEDVSHDDRVTSPSAFPAVTDPSEEPPIAARSPSRPPVAPPAHTPMPSRPSPATPPAPPLAATLGSTPAKGATPQPVVVRREPPPIPREREEKTPVPLSISLAAASPPVLPPAIPASLSPSRHSPVVALAAVPPAALAAPSETPAAPDDVVNLRAKTSKVRVLFYIVATAGGLALIGRFLTRFL